MSELPQVTVRDHESPKDWASMRFRLKMKKTDVFVGADETFRLCKEDRAEFTDSDGLAVVVALRDLFGCMGDVEVRVRLDTGWATLTWPAHRQGSFTFSDKVGEKIWITAN